MTITHKHYQSAIIGMWRMGATVQQIQEQGMPYTTYHIEQIIEEYKTYHL